MINDGSATNKNWSTASVDPTGNGVKIRCRVRFNGYLNMMNEERNSNKNETIIMRC